MPESEVFRVVVQGGSFAVLVLAAVWLARVAFPAVLRSLEREREEFTKATDAQQTQFQLALERQRADFLSTLSAVEERVEREADECRKERREQSRVIAAEREAYHESLGRVIDRVLGADDQQRE